MTFGKRGKPKYGNKKTDGYDSKKERDYALSLEQLKLVPEPQNRVVLVEKQVTYELIPAQKDAQGKSLERAVSYVADFRVTYDDGRVEVVDVKSAYTKKLPVYVLKRKLMLFIHGIKIVEV